MNAEGDIRAALIAALRGDTALSALVNHVHDGFPAKFTPPTLIVGDCAGSDWGTKDRPGRELRIGLTIEDDIETPVRIGSIMSQTDVVVQGLASPVSGWQIASLRMVRSRMLRTNRGVWNALLDYRIRVLG
ncbi:MAG: DUF3168 domain-containing protein [Sphingobium sp.]